MKTDWYKGLRKDEEKKERRELVLSARPTLEVIKALAENRLREKEAEARTRKLYESPSWAYLQADLIGAQRELQYFIDLLTLEDSDE